MAKWKCTVCGYIHEGEQPPEQCPVCKQPAEKFVKVEESKNPYAGTKTEKNLREAFAGESQARNKYTYFASVAKKAGYEQIAALFLKTADNEKEHAKLWFKALGELGDTPTNLLHAAEGENAEMNFIYQGETHPLSVVGKQNGWFLFRFEPSPLTEGTSYSLFVSTQRYVRLGLPGGETDCSFVFVSYDADGREVVRTEKNY